MKYCGDNGTFDSIVDFQYFEGSIALFQSGFFVTQEESRSQFLQSNPSCLTNGYSQSQDKIITIQQLGNDENNHDENDNPDLIWTYDNDNADQDTDPFIGNIVSFQRCAYVFNFANISSTSTIRNYNIKRYTVSIEYLRSLNRKRTVVNVNANYNINQSTSFLGYEDFPCKPTKFYYHPGIYAIMYLLDDGDSLIIKADRSFNSSSDPCKSQFLGNGNNGQYRVKIKTLIQAQGYTVKKILDNWVFLNNTLFLVVHGYKNTTNGNVDQTFIVKVAFTISSSTSISTIVTIVNTVYGFIDQIAAFELEGFIYTFGNDTGFYLVKIDTSTYSSISSTTKFSDGTKWRIYQPRVDNHMHRPIWGVNQTEPSAISRITTTYSQVFYDSTKSIDLYTYNTQFARYHALVVNPGLCTDDRDTTDYDNMKAVIINLRRMEIEKCTGLSLVGCGDGRYSSDNQEECDDGNLNDGDGCSSKCKIEKLYNCTAVEGEQSECTPIICGNQLPDDDEECDDGNFQNGDGCNITCEVEKGWSCDGFTSCTFMCGDGTIYQQNKIDQNGDSYVYYTEECDYVDGCNNTYCTPILGWNCTVNYTDMSSSCTQTCGNKIHESWEVCDDGNNLSGDGCAQGCMKVEFPYQCPLVGSCNLNCGNGYFEGTDSSIGQTGSNSEECDDGNNINGDGCSSACEKEDGFTCVNTFIKLVYEVPKFKTFCSKSSSTENSGGTTSTSQYYRYSNVNEFTFTKYSAVYFERSVSPSYTYGGRFRLIEYGDDLNLYGVTFASRTILGNDYHYIRVRQKQSGAYTYYTDTSQYSSSTQAYVQRQTFGPYYVRNLNKTSIEFLTYVKDSSTGNIEFKSFYNTTNLDNQQLLGSPEIYWWPKQEVLMARLVDGTHWKTYKFLENVYTISQDKSTYQGTSSWIENGFKRELNLDGDIHFSPIFYKNYIISYAKLNGLSGGYLRIHKFYPDIEYLALQNQRIVFNDTSTSYTGYSLVYFGSQFGVVYKAAGSSLIYRVSVPDLGYSATTLNTQGYISIFQSISDLVMIQSRSDPSNPEDTRNVYGYLSDDTIYKIEADTSTLTLKITEKIDISTKLGIFVETTRLIDVGKYHLVLHSGADCTAAKKISNLTSSSAWFYTFSTQTWSCLPLDLTYYDNYVYAWNI